MNFFAMDHDGVYSVVKVRKGTSFRRTWWKLFGEEPGAPVLYNDLKKRAFYVNDTDHLAYIKPMWLIVGDKRMQAFWAKVRQWLKTNCWWAEYAS